MNIFMTGASGYIGGVVVERLLEAGHAVAGLARSGEAASKVAERNVTVVPGNISSLDTLRTAVGAADAVIHTAVEFSPEGFKAERMAVTAMLEELAGTEKPFLFTSGPGVLGNASDRVLDEDSPYNPWPLVAERVTTEGIVLEAASKRVRTVVIRPGMVYGRQGGNGAGLYTQVAARIGVAPYLGEVEAYWPVVHVDDLADLYVLALTAAPARTIIHGMTTESVRLRDIAEAAARGLCLPGGTAIWDAQQIEQEFGPAGSIFMVNQRFASSRAETLLNWRPSRPGLLEELEHGSYAAKSA